MRAIALAVSLGLSVGTALCQTHDIVFHFGNPPVVTDRTPAQGPGINERSYEPGHPHATHFRFPLSDFRIQILEPGVLPGSNPSARAIVLDRSRDTFCCATSPTPPQPGSERFQVVLTVPEGVSLDTWTSDGATPTTFTPADGSKLSYDFVDSTYIPGPPWPWGGIGHLDTTVRAYDVQVVSFELLPGTELTPPQLRLEPSENAIILHWKDTWSRFIAEESESVDGPWRPLPVQSKSIDDFLSLAVASPAEGRRYYRLRPRPGPI